MRIVVALGGNALLRRGEATRGDQSMDVHTGPRQLRWRHSQGLRLRRHRQLEGVEVVIDKDFAAGARRTRAACGARPRLS